MNALSVVLYGSLSIAVATCVGAALLPRPRARLLVLAGSCYAVAGVLGILSIGLIFVAAAVTCFALAARMTFSAPGSHP